MRNQIHKLSDAKVNEGIFDDPQIRKIIKDGIFDTKMNPTEKEAWLRCKDVIENFLPIKRISTI